MANDGDSLSDLVDQGRRAYSEKRYKHALEAFTRAMRRCPCARGMKRDRCKCKNFEKVAAEDGGSIFKEAMYTCSCTVGKTFSKCDASLHVKALDYRAATFEAMNEMDRARADAEWLLELAPRLPEGYLRFGKIARLQKKYELAWKVYNAGIEAAGSTSRSPLLEKLHQAREPLNKMFARRNPLSLPLEIQQIIFSMLDGDLTTLLRCTRVNKAWRHYLTANGINARLWRKLHFDGRKKKIPKKSLATLIKYAGTDVRELVVEDGRRLGFDLERFLMLQRSCKNLERLELRKLSQALKLELPKVGPQRAPQEWAKFSKSRMRSFVLDGSNTSGPVTGQTLMTHVPSYPNLTDAEFLDCRSPMIGNFVVLQHLKRLRMCRSAGYYPGIEIPLLADLFKSAPNLEQLWLENFHFRGYRSVDQHLWDPEHDRVIPLRALVSRQTDADLSLRPTACGLAQLLRLTQNTLQHIDITIRQYNHPSNIFDSSRTFAGDGLSMTDYPAINFPALRSLRLQEYVVEGTLAETVFSSALNQSPTLGSFSIVFPQLEFGTPAGQQANAHIQTYGWLKGSKSIETLTLSNFSFARWDDCEKGTLPSFLASFENLKALELDTNLYEDADLCAVVEGIMKVVPSLQTVWQTAITGVPLDRLVRIGKTEGVEVKHGHIPQQWPFTLDE